MEQHREVLGFLSYANVNDANANGRLSELRDVLEAEVRDHGVPGFHVFQDKTDIRGGDEWRAMIAEKLDAAVVLFPVLTPTFFERRWCRWEVERFLARPELAAERILTFPFYFVDDLQWNDEDWRGEDPLRERLHVFQTRDLRDLRHASFRGGHGRQRIAEIGKEIAQRLLLAGRRAALAERAVAHLGAGRVADAAKELRKGRLLDEAEVCERVGGLVEGGDHAGAQVIVERAPRGWFSEGWDVLSAWIDEELRSHEAYWAALNEGALAHAAEDAARTEAARGAEASCTPGTRQRSPVPGAVDVDLAWIPAGSFLMGSPEGVGSDEERPQRHVTLSRPFWMGVTPVTQAEWAAVVRAGQGHAEAVGLAEAPSHFKGETLPVESVSWFDAARWCNLASRLAGRAPAYHFGSGENPEVTRLPEADGFRLPTEAEWEYACRAGTTTPWSHGDDEAGLAAFAWFGEGHAGTTHPVGEKLPNAWGLHDVHGNVLEWCEDRNFGAGSPGSMVYILGSSCIARGGEFHDSAAECRSARRARWRPWMRERDQGFRLVLPAT